MLNKKDPLLDVVTGVMSESDATRMAIEAANKHFGVTSRKALPHELHEAYDKMVVDESVKFYAKGNETRPKKDSGDKEKVARFKKALEKAPPVRKTEKGETVHESAETLEESEKRTPRLPVRSKYHKLVYGERLKKAAFGHSGLEFYKSDEGDLIKATYSNELPPGADDPKGSGVGRSRTRWYEGKGKGPNTTIKPIKNPTLKEAAYPKFAAPEVQKSGWGAGETHWDRATWQHEDGTLTQSTLTFDPEADEFRTYNHKMSKDGGKTWEDIEKPAGHKMHPMAKKHHIYMKNFADTNFRDDTDDGLDDIPTTEPPFKRNQIKESKSVVFKAAPDPADATHIVTTQHDGVMVRSRFAESENVRLGATPRFSAYDYEQSTNGGETWDDLSKNPAQKALRAAHRQLANKKAREIYKTGGQLSETVFDEIRINILNEMASITDEEKLMSYIDNLSEEQMDILGLAEASASDKKKPEAEQEDGLVKMPPVPKPKVSVQDRQLGAQGAAGVDQVSARPATVTGPAKSVQTRAITQRK
jgi:cell fate (sporulation/competence/biofilm development) regulator YmcA (YheA/YmcA/DUF963 family)